MDLLTILQYKMLIFINRLKNISLLDNIKFIILILVLIFILSIFNFKCIELFQANINPELFIFCLFAITIFSVPFGIRKVYDTYFHSSDNVLLYTWPISRNTVLLFKHIQISLRLSIPYIILGIPSIISFGIIKKYSILYFILAIILLLIYISFISEILELITLIMQCIIPLSNKEEVIYFISRALNLILLIVLNLVMFNIKKLNPIDIVNSYATIDLRLIKNILYSIHINKINIISCSGFVILVSTLFVIHIIIFNNMFKKGIFTGSTDINKKTCKNNKVTLFNKILIILFPKSNVFIYKDLIIFFRTLKEWDLILSPLIYTIILFILVYKRDIYGQLLYYSMFLFLWIATNLAFSSVKNEGMMIDTIKNSTFNLKHIIFSKILYVIILSIPVLVLINSIILIFFKLSFFEWVILILISSISIIVPSVIGIPCLLYNYNLEGKDQQFRNNVEAMLYLKLIMIFVPVYYSFKWIIKSELNIYNKYILLILIVIILYIITQVLLIRTYAKFLDIQKKEIRKMKVIKQILLIIAPIIVFTPRVLRSAFNMQIPKPLSLGMILLGMVLIGIGMALKEKKS